MKKTLIKFGISLLGFGINRQAKEEKTQGKEGFWLELQDIVSKDMYENPDRYYNLGEHMWEKFSEKSECSPNNPKNGSYVYLA